MFGVLLRSIFGNLASVLALASGLAAGAAIGGVAGYLHGKHVADQSAMIADLFTVIEGQKSTIAEMEAAAKLAEKQAGEQTAAEVANETESKGITDAIARTPRVDGSASVDFLRRLRALR